MQITEIGPGTPITHIALVGRLDAEGMMKVDIKFHGYTAARKKSAIVDLSQVEFIASLGIGMLISCAKALQRHGARMVLITREGTVEGVLKAMGIDQVIPMVRTEAEAMGLLVPGA